MDVTVTSAFCFLLLILPQISLQQICNPPISARIKENNKVGETVVTISVQEGVTLELHSESTEYFTVEGNVVKAAVQFDFETTESVDLSFDCVSPSGQRLPKNVVVFVLDVNENAPTFDKPLYELSVPELSPPNTLVGTIAAKDEDQGGNGRLYYRLTPDSVGFSLQQDGISGVKIVTTKSFDYDKDKHFQLELYVQDTAFGSTDFPSFNDTTTINVTVTDTDNRPPWFQPCTQYEISGSTLCVNNQGYTGSVYLNEQQPGAIELNPNPILAVDGDFGINERIVYSILGGNDAGVFEIDRSTGSITMLKAVTTLGSITLTVLAAQETNVHQFATTTVSIAVLTKSDHKPQFPRPLYEGIVSGVGVMADNKNDMGNLLRILATDEDFGPGGENPHLVYSIVGDENFSLYNGYLFMTTKVPDKIYRFEVHAVDSTNKELATTMVSVEVNSAGPTLPPSTATTSSEIPEVTATSAGPNLSPGTTISDSSGPTENSSIPNVSTPVVVTSTSVTPENITSSVNPSGPTPVVATTTGTTPGNVIPSGNPSGSTPVVATSTGNPNENTAGTTADSTVTGGGGVTPSPNPPGDGTASTANTQNHAGAPGGFDSTDMAALGATLGVLLFLALVIMAILFFRLRRENKDWKKIHESNVFRSTLGQNSGGAKEGIQYTNNAFDDDEDNNSRGSGSPVSGVVLSTLANDYSKYESVVEPRPPPQDDASSQSGSEKEVKPILTKERRVEEGYKSVWFKEDIDPNAKEEVVIIPDSRENVSDEDEDSSSDKETRDDSPRRRSRVMFSNFADSNGGEVQSIDL